MFRRRKRKNTTINNTQSESTPSLQAPYSDTPPRTTVSAHQDTKASPLLTDAFKSTIEKAADRSRSVLASEGKLKPMAFFVHADGAMKTVSLSFKNEYQKDVLIGRIREKALEENIATVITLTEMDNEKRAVLSGVGTGMKGSVSIDYSFNNTTETVTLWKMTWLNQACSECLP